MPPKRTYTAQPSDITADDFPSRLSYTDLLRNLDVGKGFKLPCQWTHDQGKRHRKNEDGKQTPLVNGMRCLGYSTMHSLAHKLGINITTRCRKDEKGRQTLYVLRIADGPHRDYNKTIKEDHNNND